MNNTLFNSNKILKSYQYARIAYKQDKKTRLFLQNANIFNKVTGEINKIEYNKEWHLNQTYLYNTFRIDWLNKEELKAGKIPIFLTITLPSKFHPKSLKFDNSLSVQQGYEELNKIFREIYNQFRVNRKFQKIKYIRVIEPHKSFIPHLHAVCYVDTNLVQDFKKHFYRIKRKYQLKQVDYKQLEKADFAVTYLLKYVKKTLEGDDVYRGWRIHHKINRVLTMSNLNNGMTRDIFKRITKFIKFDVSDSRNYLEQILSKIYIERMMINEFGEVLNFKSYGKIESEYSVYVVYEKSKKINDLTYDKEIINDEMIFEDEYLIKLKYLRIYDRDEKLFDLEDYQFYVDDVGWNVKESETMLIYEYEDMKIITNLDERIINES